jgi:hypothetical protein
MKVIGDQSESETICFGGLSVTYKVAGQVLLAR